jgi:hypothetical protein
MSADTEEVDTAEPEADGPTTTEALGGRTPLDGSRRLPNWFPIAFIALAFVMLAGLVVWQWRYDSDLAGERDERKAAMTVASTFAEKLLTYDYKDLATARANVTALVTDSYKQMYEQAFTIGLEPQITKLQATSVAHVQEVYLTEVSKDQSGATTAKAIVVVDADTTSTAGTRTLQGTFLKLDLVKSNGKFLVNAVTAVSTANESLTPPAGATTTTTVPTSQPASASGS